MSLSCYRRFLIPFFAILFCISSPQTYGLEASDYEKYRKAAEQGDAGAQYNLGSCYAMGEGVVKDEAEAVKWLRKAAEQGHSDAQYNLGRCYYSGEGVEKDILEAVKWLRMAAEQGHLTAQNNLGSFYDNGEGVVKNEILAYQWFLLASANGNKTAERNLPILYAKLTPEQLAEGQRLALAWAAKYKAKKQEAAGTQEATGKLQKADEIASEPDAVETDKPKKKPVDEPKDEFAILRDKAESGDAEAQRGLALRYAFGQGVVKDEAEAVKWWRKAAEQRDASAQFNLGNCYGNGQGVVKDEAEAVKWYIKAAEQGHSDAQHNLALCYANGQGVAKDEAEAVKWWRMAAEQGLAEAQRGLGVSYEKGQGVAKNEAEAVKWYFKAAEQGNASAQFNLGGCYYNGKGVAKDGAKAVKWWRKAAEQGNALAQGVIGIFYANGEVVKKDVVEAVKWHRKAAEQGLAEAQTSLGACYANGEGVVKNPIEGYKWGLLAAAQGNGSAKKSVSFAERSLSPAQRAEGQRLAQEWEARHANREANQGVERRPEAAVAEDDPKTTGTGFLITRNGYLVTNHHVVEDCGKVRVHTAAGLLDAEVVRVDAASDLALLKVTGTFDALPVVSSRGARLGATVATVGFPNIGLQGFEPKLSKGDISSLAGIQDDVRYFQISVPVQPGNSGGALVDEHGNVVGIVSAQLSQKAALESSGTLAQSVNYAVKSSYLLSFLEAVPEASEGMPDAKTHEQKFEAMVDDVKKATVLIIGY